MATPVGMSGPGIRMPYGNWTRRLNQFLKWLDRKAMRIRDWVTEEFEEGGGEEGVGEFEGVAAGAAQPVRLLQLPRDPPLLGQVAVRNLDRFESSPC